MPGVKVAKLLNAGDVIELARQIARRNGYRENAKLNSQEAILRGKSRRFIFEIQKGQVAQYLSLDFENAQFEVCDEKGRHQGVFNFSGRKTDDADDKRRRRNIQNHLIEVGEHDIWALQL